MICMALYDVEQAQSFWFCQPAYFASRTSVYSAGPLDPSDSWEWWNRARCMCGHNGQLGVALELGPAVPPPSELQRWFGEPVRAIIVPTSTFQPNKRGFPALSKAHQAVLVSFFQLGVQVSSSLQSRWSCMGQQVKSS